MNPEDVKRYTFRIVPVIRNNPFEQKSSYRFEMREDMERPVFVAPAEPENMDCTDALAVIATIKAKL